MEETLNILARSNFVEECLEVMRDADWSGHSNGDLKAASVALWEQGERTPRVDAMALMLKCQYGYFADYSAFAHGEKDTQSFMDKADELRLGSSVLDQLSQAVTRSLMARYEEKGWLVVDLKSGQADALWVEPDEEGFYVFVGEKS